MSIWEAVYTYCRDYMIHDPDNDGIKYLLHKGYSLESIHAFALGWAPGAEKIRDAIEKQGFSIAQIKDSGLLQFDGDLKPYDEFSDRIIFPCTNIQGEIVGLSGLRAHKGRQPIWLFSRGCKDNTGFWGLEEARPYILKDGSAEIYEFPTHLLEAYAKGVRNAVCLPPVLDYAALAAYGYALKSDLTVSKVVLKFIDDEYGRSRAVKIERAFENMGILVEKNFEKINS